MTTAIATGKSLIHAAISALTTSLPPVQPMRMPNVYGAKLSHEDRIVGVSASHVFARKRRSKYSPNECERLRLEGKR